MSDKSSYIGWRLKEARANLSDFFGLSFIYNHAVIGKFMYRSREKLSRMIYLYGYENPELRYAKDAVKKGGTFVDVGANIGMYSVACKNALTANEHGYAWEPGNRTFNKLKNTFKILGLSDIQVFPYAAGESQGKIKFLTSLDGWEAHQRVSVFGPETGFEETEVTVSTLDTLCGDVDRVAFVKLDIEGCEVKALRGAKKILANKKVKLLVEINADGLQRAGNSIEELLQLLRETHRCRYIFFSNGSQVEPNSQDDYSQITRLCNTAWEPLDA